MAEQEFSKQLMEYSSCDVADALQKLGHPQGGFLHSLTLWSPERQQGPTRIAGPVYTVKFVDKDVEVSTTAAAAGHYIDTLPPSSILFISAPSPVDDQTNAVYGGLMSLRAQHLGAAGTIVDGRIRDLQEHRDLGFPVWARDVGVASPGGVWRVGAINEPVFFPHNQTPNPTTTIYPNDYILADLNGVVLIPRDSLQHVLQLMPSQVRADELIAVDLKEGVSLAEAARERRRKVLKVEDIDR